MLVQKKPIQVVAYNPLWPDQFTQEANRLTDALGPNVIDIHHIGSTAVPELAAKNEIDMILVVHDLAATRALEKEGYTFKGEINIPLRYFFYKNDHLTTINLHVCPPNHGFIALNIWFRDWLRHHEEDKKRYQDLKYRILESADACIKRPGKLSNYTLKKNSFIKSLLQRSAYQGHIVNFCLHDEEWQYVKKAHQQLLSSNKKSNIPVTCHFTDPLHKHCILYQGTTIVSYLHLHLVSDTETVVMLQHPEYDPNSPLFCTLKQWLTLQGYTKISIPGTNAHTPISFPSN